ncbi:NfeD family protein [Thermosulfuriphilus sp.]
MFWLLAALDPFGAWATPSPLYLIKIEGAIDPITSEFIISAIETTSVSGGQALIIRLDTPGGLVSATREIIKALLNSPVPVIVYVAPSGARAASAGTLITMAAHIAAMAPGTNIGAAHPVSLGGPKEDKKMAEKAVNDLAAMARAIASTRGRNAKWAEEAVRKSVSITEEEALRLKVIDLIAKDLGDLLEKINGCELEVSGGRRVRLETKAATLIPIHQGLRERILRAIGDPNIAYILMMIGLAGLYFELSNPGTIFPGVVGALALVLAFFAFKALPVNYAGLILILLAGIFFFLEIKITSFGLLALAGLIALTLGSLMLFSKAPGVGISWSVLWPTLIGVGAFLSILTYLAAKAVRSPPQTGAESLLGAEGKALSEIGPEGGQVFVHGEIWQAESDHPVAAGSKVRVLAVKSLTLKVEEVK